MAELILKSHRFRLEREEDWRRLEKLVTRAEKGSLKSLTDDEIVALPVLYRAALSSLSVARATSLDQATVDYLESLATRAYFFVYGARTSLTERVALFFTRDWPAAVKALWRETAVAALLTILGAVVAYLLVSHDPDWYYAFIPQQMASGRDPTATTAFLRDTLYGQAHKTGQHDALTILATFLFTHNAEVALFAFALGFAFCLPTALLIVYNGCSLGAFLALFFSRHLGFAVCGWLFVHGVTELFAVTLAGAAGFRIGWAVAFPGQESRLEAASKAGRHAALVMCGVAIMLFCAGMLEGIVRQTVTIDLARYAIALTTALVWGLYFYAPRVALARRRELAHG